jgi:CheY-like chemotaxis protein
MKILIADDDINKRERITSFINAKFKDKFKITEKKSYQSTLKCIQNEYFNLIILDMTMPTYDISIEENGGRIKVFAGKEIMSKMIRRDIIMPVIVMTQFETFGEDEITFNELEKELESSYNEIFEEIIYYHNGLTGWQNKLENKLNNVIRNK